MFAISHGIILFLGSYRKQMHMMPAQPWLLVPESRSQLGLLSKFWIASSTDQRCYETQWRKANRNDNSLVHMLDTLSINCLVLPILLCQQGLAKPVFTEMGHADFKVSAGGASRGNVLESHTEIMWMTPWSIWDNWKSSFAVAVTGVILGACSGNANIYSSKYHQRGFMKKRSSTTRHLKPQKLLWSLRCFLLPFILWIIHQHHIKTFSSENKWHQGLQIKG